MAAENARLPEPYELLDLADGASESFVPVRYERGTMEIRPRWRGAPATKEIPVLRVHVRTEDKPFFPHYWDVTSKTAAAQLLPMLMDPRARDYMITVTKYGVAPRARFTVARGPLP